MKASEILIIAFILAILAEVVIESIDAYECTQSGGTVVRGVFGFECIGGGS